MARHMLKCRHSLVCTEHTHTRTNANTHTLKRAVIIGQVTHPISFILKQAVRQPCWVNITIMPVSLNVQLMNGWHPVKTLKQKNCPLTFTVLERLLYLPTSLTSDSFSVFVTFLFLTCCFVFVSVFFLLCLSFFFFLVFCFFCLFVFDHSRKSQEVGITEKRKGLAFFNWFTSEFENLLYHITGCAEWNIYMKLEHWKDYLYPTLIWRAAGHLWQCKKHCEVVCGKGIVYIRCFLLQIHWKCRKYCYSPHE